MLLRRWYVVAAGLVIAVALAYTAWNAVEPEYERQGTQIVLPGLSSLPEGATNPYLYLSGLSLPTDIVAQAVTGENVLGEVLQDFPGASVEVVRTGTSAPILSISVKAASDDAAEELLDIMMQSTVTTLADMQESEGISSASQMSIMTLTVDTESKTDQRKRLLTAGGIGLGMLVVSLGLAALIDGLITRRRRSGKGSRRRATAAEGDPIPMRRGNDDAVDDGAADDDAVRDDSAPDVASDTVASDDAAPDEGALKRDRASAESAEG